jgi:hypothetical protein
MLINDYDCQEEGMDWPAVLASQFAQYGQQESDPKRQHSNMQRFRPADTRFYSGTEVGSFEPLQ